MSLRIAIVKPDWGITGGFELLTNEVARRLEADGHRLHWMSPKVGELTSRPFGISTDEIRQASPEFLRYIQLAEAFGELDLHRADLVLSTQPPSYAVDHPHHLALFSHHYRCFYDLSDVMVEAGMLPDVELHRQAERRVRELDGLYLGRTPYVLATSEEVKSRLSAFNGLDRTVGVFHAGLGFKGDFPEPASSDRYETVLCVSRHEFPKRTELFVQAMAGVRDVEAVSVGQGGRLGHVMELAGAPGDSLTELDPRSLWCNTVDWIQPPSLPARVGPVRFTGHVSADELDALYRNALCVVAPAYLEDYGLTAIEAMAYGKPLIVCRDGGNLTNFVTDHDNGFVVEPTGQAIAAAVQTLADDRGLAARMGAAAREVAREYTWENAMKELSAGVDEVMSS